MLYLFHGLQEAWDLPTGEKILQLKTSRGLSIVFNIKGITAEDSWSLSIELEIEDFAAV